MQRLESSQIENSKSRVKPANCSTLPFPLSSSLSLNTISPPPHPQSCPRKYSLIPASPPPQNPHHAPSPSPPRTPLTNYQNPTNKPTTHSPSAPPAPPRDHPKPHPSSQATADSTSAPPSSSVYLHNSHTTSVVDTRVASRSVATSKGRLGRLGACSRGRRGRGGCIARWRLEIGGWGLEAGERVQGHDPFGGNGLYKAPQPMGVKTVLKAEMESARWL